LGDAAGRIRLAGERKRVVGCRKEQRDPEGNASNFDFGDAAIVRLANDPLNVRNVLGFKKHHQFRTGAHFKNRVRRGFQFREI